jgi:iron-sulfur cluster assembly protein
MATLAKPEVQAITMLNTDPQVQTDPTIQTEPLVILSDAAAGKLRDLVEAEQNPQIGLRVYVYSGGCSGFRYGMMLEDQPSSEDLTVESKGIKVYVDPQSTQYLGGAEIDYLDTLMGAGFTVNNPNAVSACGCGSSFRTEESAGQPGACHH